MLLLFPLLLSLHCWEALWPGTLSTFILCYTSLSLRNGRSWKFVTKPEMKRNPLPLQFGWEAVGKILPFEKLWAFETPQGFPSCKPRGFWGKESLGAFPGTCLGDSRSDAAFRPDGCLASFSKPRKCLAEQKSYLGLESWWKWASLNIEAPARIVKSLCVWRSVLLCE